MAVFWRTGYEGSSVTSLTQAMGINSPSLYACFGNKEGLFKAVLERYDGRRISFMKEVMAAPDATTAARTFLMGVVDFATDTGGKNPPGCLMLQGGISCGDSVIPDTLARHRAEKEAMLRDRFEQARDSGDLAANSDPAALARYLMVMSNGICIQATTGATPEELREVATLALAGWPGVKVSGKQKRLAPA